MAAGEEGPGWHLGIPCTTGGLLVHADAFCIDKDRGLEMSQCSEACEKLHVELRTAA